MTHFIHDEGSEGNCLPMKWSLIWVAMNPSSAEEREPRVEPTTRRRGPMTGFIHDEGRKLPAEESEAAREARGGWPGGRRRDDLVPVAET